MFEHSVTDNTFTTIEGFVFRDSDISIEEFWDF